MKLNKEDKQFITRMLEDERPTYRKAMERLKQVSPADYTRLHDTATKLGMMP